MRISANGTFPIPYNCVHRLGFQKIIDHFSVWQLAAFLCVGLGLSGFYNIYLIYVYMLSCSDLCRKENLCGLVNGCRTWNTFSCQHHLRHSLSCFYYLSRAMFRMYGCRERNWMYFFFYNTTLLPRVSITALGMFCGAKHTHHTFTSIIKHKLQQQQTNIRVKSHS